MPEIDKGEGPRAFRAKSFGMRAIGDIRLLEIADGEGRGQRILSLYNGAGLEVEIAVDRGFDLARLRYKGINIGWLGPTAYPAPINASEDSGLGLLRSFDGFMVTCGLDHHGLPAQGPADHLIYPNRSSVHYPLHGRVSGLKARLESYCLVEDTDEPYLECTGVVRQAAVFGEVLELRRTVRLPLLDGPLSIVDRVTNLGSRIARHGILYHVNIGYPLLDRETRMLGVSEEFASEFVADPPIPDPDRVETFKLVEPSSSTPTRITVHNPLLGGLSLTMSYNPADLPQFGVWQAYQSGLFALGLEPFVPLDDPSAPITTDRADVLLPGEARTYSLLFELSKSS